MDKIIHTKNNHEKAPENKTLREVIDRIRTMNIKWPKDVLADIRKGEEKD